MLLSKYIYSDFIELDEKKDEFKKRCGYCSDLSKCNYASSTCLNERRSDKKQDYNTQGNVHVLQILVQLD